MMALRCPMTEVTLTTYLCNKGISAIEYSKKDSFEISFTAPSGGNPGTINSALSKTGNAATGLITLQMLKNTDTIACSVYENLDIQYPATFDDYPIISYAIPDSCNWVKAIVNLYGFTCEPDGCFYSQTVRDYGIGGNIPEPPNDTNKELVFHSSDDIETELIQNLIVPGQKLILTYDYLVNGIVITLPAGQLYYDVPWLTSGVITGVSGNPALDDNATFNVLGYFGTEDTDSAQTIACARTDWVEWEVGDWVYVIRNLNQIIPMSVGAYPDGS